MIHSQKPSLFVKFGSCERTISMKVKKLFQWTLNTEKSQREMEREMEIEMEKSEKVKEHPFQWKKRKEKNIKKLPIRAISFEHARQSRVRERE